MFISIRATQFNTRERKARLEEGCSVKTLKERKKERKRRGV
jgi:hypothetical protein